VGYQNNIDCSSLLRCPDGNGCDDVDATGLGAVGENPAPM
jgi:hypothetical protein